MANVILVASSQKCLEDLEHLANRLREEEHSPCVMTWQDRNASRLRKECAGKHLALIGIMGSPDEIQAGFDAACVVATHCRMTAVAICLDAPGYAFYAMQKDTPHSHRIRFAVLVGEKGHFPHIRSLIRVGGKHIAVEDDWLNDEVEQVVQAITDESQHKVIAA